MKRLSSVLLLVCSVLAQLLSTGALDNGVARTPPMGWMSWQRYRCQIDCDLYPDECVSERLIKRTVDRLVADGYREAGYRYVIIDDCWQARERHGVTQELIADPKRFPSGIKALGDYIHSKGLLFGIYLDYGTLTCAGYPGSIDYLEVDARSMAEWGVDYVKMDGCNSRFEEMPGGYEKFGRLLNQTGRPMVFSCSYPAYVNWRTNPSVLDWGRLMKNCNLWRMFPDIQDSWDSLLILIDSMRTEQNVLKKLAGPGHWNDPDMLLLGNFGLSRDQQRVQMGMWAMLASPLLISAEMDRMDEYSKSLLLNPRLLAINQDPNGRQAVNLGVKNGVQLWTRPVTHQHAKWAIAFVYQVSGGGPTVVPITLDEMGIKGYKKNRVNLYILKDAFDGSVFGVVQLKEQFLVRVNPNGITMFEVEEKGVLRGMNRYDFLHNVFDKY